MWTKHGRTEQKGVWWWIYGWGESWKWAKSHQIQSQGARWCQSIQWWQISTIDLKCQVTWLTQHSERKKAFSHEKMRQRVRSRHKDSKFDDQSLSSSLKTGMGNRDMRRSGSRSGSRGRGRGRRNWTRGSRGESTIPKPANKTNNQSKIDTKMEQNGSNPQVGTSSQQGAWMHPTMFFPGVQAIFQWCKCNHHSWECHTLLPTQETLHSAMA